MGAVQPGDRLEARVEGLEPLMQLTNPWRLSLLFLVSGAATAFLWDRRARAGGGHRWREVAEVAAEAKGRMVGSGGRAPLCGGGAHGAWRNLAFAACAAPAVSDAGSRGM